LKSINKIFINEYKLKIIYIYLKNKIYICIFKVLYNIALIHNNSSTFVILVLINCLNLKLSFKDNLLHFHKCLFNLCLEEKMFDLFNYNPMIKKYIVFVHKPFQY